MSADTSPLKFKEKFGYSLGDAASNFFFQVFNIFLLYYYTDVYGLAPAAVGTMFIVTKIIDAVSDPAMGLIADRTETKWGKFRPYILWAAIPYGLFGFLMFAGPDLSDTGKLVYAYISYTAMMLAYTAVNVPYSALLGVISPVSLERAKVASFRFAAAFTAGWLIATFVVPLKNALGGGDEQLGFRLTMGIFAVVSILLFWACFASTKERVHPPQEKSDIKEDFASLLHNGPWFALFFSAVFALTNVAIRGGATLFFMKYYVGDDGAPLFRALGLDFSKTAVFLSSGTLALLCGILATQMVLRHFDKRKLMIALTLANAVIMGVFFFIPPEMYWTMVAINCAGAFVIGPTLAIVWSMYADCADYGEWKTGRRTTGLIFSASQFAQKLGLAVGAGLAGYILSLFGYIADQEQTETARLGIRLMFTVFPAVLAGLSGLAILFYKIDNKTLRQMEADLAETRKTASAPAPG
ncbi:MAG: MFS transporter [Woeseiaceae bacterium]|nr:MFS transporter [Woeseiaceae bacterium]